MNLRFLEALGGHGGHDFAQRLALTEVKVHNRISVQVPLVIQSWALGHYAVTHENDELAQAVAVASPGLVLFRLCTVEISKKTRRKRKSFSVWRAWFDRTAVREVDARRKKY